MIQVSDLQDHPLVHAFMDGQSAVQSYLRDCADPALRPICDGLQGMATSRRPSSDPRSVHGLIDRINELGLSADIHAILHYWCLALLQPTEEDELLGRCFRELSNAAIAVSSPLISSLPTQASAWLANPIIKGEQTKQLSLAPTNFYQLMRLSLIGVAEPSITYLEQLGTDKHSRPIDRLQIKLFNSIQSGNVELTTSLLGTVEVAHEKNRQMLLHFLPAIWLMQSLLSGIHPTKDQITERMQQSGLPDVSGGLEGNNRFAWDINNLMMIPVATSAELRRQLDEPDPTRQRLLHSANSLINVNPIRAAVILGDIDLASDMLQDRSRTYSNTYLDHLFWMRLHLLDQDERKAADHLHALLEGGRYHRAMGRVEVELRLSRELNLCQLASLYSRRPATMIQRPGPDPSVGKLDQTLIGTSDSMAQVRQQIRTYAEHLLPVLILGETGTGKDLVARTLHEQSSNHRDPFIAVNCGAMNDNLLEAELFGHTKGSYTGASSHREGLIAAAGTGTLFLDEIGETSPRFQVALLRLLENKEYRSIGSDSTSPLRCRIVAATNARLDEAVQSGHFREDLIYRLDRLSIILPPLRERPQDIVPLCLHFLNRDQPRTIQLENQLAEFFSAEPWHGNVRQLRNEMELLRIHHPMKQVLSLDDYLELPIRQGGTVYGGPTTRSFRRTPEPVGSQEAGAESFDATTVQPSTLGTGSPLMFRLQRLRELFQQHRQLTRKQCIAELGVSHSTMTSYLKRLCSEGLIEKVMPNKAPISHYFRLRDDA